MPTALTIGIKDGSIDEANNLLAFVQAVVPLADTTYVLTNAIRVGLTRLTSSIPGRFVEEEDILVDPGDPQTDTNFTSVNIDDDDYARGVAWIADRAFVTANTQTVFGAALRTGMAILAGQDVVLPSPTWS